MKNSLYIAPMSELTNGPIYFFMVSMSNFLKLIEGMDLKYISPRVYPTSSERFYSFFHFSTMFFLGGGPQSRLRNSGSQ